MFHKHFKFAKIITKRVLNVSAVVVVGVVAYKWRVNHVMYAAQPMVSVVDDEQVDSVIDGDGKKQKLGIAKWNANWDRREPSSLVRPPKGDGDAARLKYEEGLKECTPTAKRNLILIRHGQYFDNADNDKERFLTSLGRVQADFAGQRLKELNVPYTVLTSSTMTRAVETAQIIHKHVPQLTHETDDSLREGAPVPPEPPSKHWVPEPREFFQDGMRIESAFRKYFHRADSSQKEDSYEIIVCHGNVIRYFVCRALQIPPESWLRFALAHSSITHIEIRPTGNLSVMSVGDHGFIPAEKVSYS